VNRFKVPAEHESSWQKVRQILDLTEAEKIYQFSHQMAFLNLNGTRTMIGLWFTGGRATLGFSITHTFTRT
jgi:hypothetical protein